MSLRVHSVAVVQHHAIPLAYGGVGMAFLVAGSVLLTRAAPALSRGEWGAPAVVGAVHAFTLGWLLTLIVGTLYQLGPVALQVAPRSSRLWRWLLPAHALGVITVVWGVSAGRLHDAAHGWAVLTLVTAASAIVQLGPWRAPSSTRLRMRLVTLGFVSLAGVLVLAAMRLVWGWRGYTPDLDGLRLAHVAFGLSGFGTLVAWAVGSHVIPMFLGVREEQSFSALAIPLLLFGGAALLLPAVLPALSYLRPAAVMIIACGQLLMLWRAARWFRHRPKIAWDPALTTVAMSFMALAVATALQLALAAASFANRLSPTDMLVQRAIAVWGVLYLAGWLSLLIVGVLFRVFVFLSWTVRAGPGTQPATGAPVRVQQFSRPALAWASVVLYALALVSLSMAIAVGSSAGARFAAKVYVAATLCMSLHHALAMFASPRAVISAPARPSLSLATSPQ